MLKTDEFNKIKEMVLCPQTAPYSNAIFDEIKDKNELKVSNRYTLKDTDEYQELLIDEIRRDKDIPDFFCDEITVSIPKEYEISSVFQKLCYIESENGDRIIVPISCNVLEHKYYTLSDLFHKLQKINIPILYPIISETNDIHNELDNSPVETSLSIIDYKIKGVSIDYIEPWNSWGDDLIYEKTEEHSILSDRDR